MVDFPDGSRMGFDPDCVLMKSVIGLPYRWNTYGTLLAGHTVNLSFTIPDGENIYYLESIMLMFKSSPVTVTDITVKGVSFGRHYNIGSFSFSLPSKAPFYLERGDVILVTIVNEESSEIAYDAIFQLVRFLKPSGFGTRPYASFIPSAVSGNTSTVFTFTNASKFSPTSYDWDFGDGSAHSVSTNPTHKYNSVGTYYVVLTAYNTHGVDRYSVIVTIS